MRLKNLFYVFIMIIMFASCLTPESEYKRANELKQKIDKYELKEYAEAEYQTAEDNYDKGKVYMDEKKNMQASKHLKEANKNYETVIDKGLPPYTEKKDVETKEEKGQAEEIKAYVAVKEQYEEAEKSYNEALKYKDKKNYEKAIEFLNDAKTKYEHAYDLSYEKKTKAKESIDSTEEIKREIEKNAEELDRKIKELEKELNK